MQDVNCDFPHSVLVFSSAEAVDWEEIAECLTDSLILGRAGVEVEDDESFEKVVDYGR